MPMHPYSIQNPVFLMYMIAAAIMILKLMGQGWMTVYRMIKSDSGLLNPEDLTPGPSMLTGLAGFSVTIWRIFRLSWWPVCSSWRFGRRRCWPAH